MDRMYSDRCYLCGQEIFFGREDAYVKCPSCGATLDTSRLGSKQRETLQELERGRQARMELIRETSARQEAEARLHHALRALESISDGQQLENDQLENILRDMGEDRAAVQSLIDGVMAMQASGQTALMSVIQSVLSQQGTEAERLAALMDVAERMLEAQSSGADMQEAVLAHIQADGRQKERLIRELTAWSQSAREEDKDLLEQIRAGSAQLLSGQARLSKQVERVEQTADVTRRLIEGQINQSQKAADERRERALREAMEHQRHQRFDEAVSGYRAIIRESGETLDLCWRLVECHYGICYEENEQGKRKPTFLRPDLSPPEYINERRALNRLLENEPDGVRKLFEEKLSEIDGILNTYRQLRDENQFDVFISVRQEGIDKKKADALYMKMTDWGLKVFNSERFDFPQGSSWEPYIVAALLSAKVMIVVGSSAENMESTWVRNEWMRFQWLMEHENGRNARTLICYLIDMSPASLPGELDPGRQAIKDDTDTLRKSLARLFPHNLKLNPVGAAAPVAVNTAESAETIIAKMRADLAAGQYETVLSRYAQLEAQGRTDVLGDYEAPLLKLCALRQFNEIDQLRKVKKLEDEALYQQALRCARPGDERDYVLSLVRKKKPWWLLWLLLLLLLLGAGAYIASQPGGIGEFLGIEPTPQPTAAPVTVYVDVLYTDEAGHVLASKKERVSTGVTYIREDAAKAPEGYTLLTSSTVKLEVDYEGICTPARVEFVYQKLEPVETNLSVHYYDDTGALIASASEIVRTGINTVRPKASLVPPGYTLKSDNAVTVEVDYAGNCMPREVSFTYQRPARVTVNVPVYYYDTQRHLLATTMQSVTTGENTVQVDSALAPEGYTLTSSREVTVTVDYLGVCTPAGVEFIYQAPPAVTVPMTVHYYDQTGAVLAYETVEVITGENRIRAKNALVPAGYTLQSDNVVDVTVDYKGNCTPSAVDFVYKAPDPVTVSIAVSYRDEDGVVFHVTTQQVTTGDNRVWVDDELVPAGYTLVSESPVNVTVDYQGKCKPMQVNFTFKKPPATPTPTRKPTATPSPTPYVCKHVNLVDMPGAWAYNQLVDGEVQHYAMRQVYVCCEECGLQLTSYSQSERQDHVYNDKGVCEACKYVKPTMAPTKAPTLAPTATLAPTGEPTATPYVCKHTSLAQYAGEWIYSSISDSEHKAARQVRDLCSVCGETVDTYQQTKTEGHSFINGACAHCGYRQVQTQAPATKKPTEAPTPTPTPTKKPTATPELTAEQKLAKQLAGAKQGEYVTFGKYYQTSGASKSPIEWLVLEKSSDRMLLISRYCLDSQLYHKRLQSITWEDSSLRTWLNSTFLNAAFDTTAQKLILSTTLDNDAGGKTTDKIYLLSENEAEWYFANNYSRIATPTLYAKEQGAFTNSEGAVWWWLRSRGSAKNKASGVNGSGRVDTTGDDVNMRNGRSVNGVRPVLWVDLDP